MKSLKFLAASTLALAVAGSAFAQTYVRITGSTAFRTATVAAIIDSLNSPQAAFVGSSVNGANQAVIRGTLKSGGADVAFSLAWAGSVGGMQTVVKNLTVPPGTTFTDVTTWLSATGNTLSPVSVAVTGGGYIYTFTGGTAVSPGVFTAASLADVTMSDSFQSSTTFKSPALVSSAGLNSGIVGIIPFVWVKGPKASNVAQASYDHLTNITTENARTLLTSGAVPLSVFTGNTADQNIDVIVSGRNNDSGTRLAAFAESQFGIQSSPTQWILTNDGTNITNVGTAYAPTGGQSSGGTLTKAVAMAPLATAAATETNGLPFIVVTYAGVADAMNVNAGQNVLAYNGFIAPIQVSGVLDIFNGGLAGLIQQGQYTFWEYEHLYYRSSFSGVAKTAADALALQIATDALAAGMKNDTTMQASRVDELNPIISLLR